MSRTLSTFIKRRHPDWGIRIRGLKSGKYCYICSLFESTLFFADSYFEIFLFPVSHREYNATSFRSSFDTTIYIFVIILKISRPSNETVSLCHHYRYLIPHCASPQFRWCANLAQPGNPVLVVPAKRHYRIYLLLATKIQSFYTCKSRHQFSKRAHISNLLVQLTMSLYLMCLIPLF